MTATAPPTTPATPATPTPPNSSGLVAAQGPPSAPTAAGAARLTALVAAGALAAVVLVALVVDLTLAGTVRGWLDYPFTGVPARPSVAAGIFAHNLRVVAGVFGLVLVARAAQRGPDGPRGGQRLLVVVAELAITGAVIANLIIVGAAVGAYRARMIVAMLPHGPVELAGYALALALYCQGRRRMLPAGYTVAAAAVSIGLLAVAAVLETFA